MKATKSKMAIGAVVLLRETLRDPEEKQGFNGLPRLAMSQISLTGLERYELSSLGRLQSLQIMLWETVGITMLYALLS
jgi:hypothetical protein